MSLPELDLIRNTEFKVKENYTINPRTLEDKAIRGSLWEGKELICRSIECPNLQNQLFISCIPAGRYKAIIHKSAGLGYKVFYLQDVTGRTMIYFHVSNTVFHYKTLKRLLKGCVGVGEDPAFFKNEESGKFIPAVTNSADTLKMLMTRFPNGFYVNVKDET